MGISGGDGSIVGMGKDSGVRSRARVDRLRRFMRNNRERKDFGGLRKINLLGEEKVSISEFLCGSFERSVCVPLREGSWIGEEGGWDWSWSILEFLLLFTKGVSISGIG